MQIQIPEEHSKRYSAFYYTSISGRFTPKIIAVLIIVTFTMSNCPPPVDHVNHVNHHIHHVYLVPKLCHFHHVNH